MTRDEFKALTDKGVVLLDGATGSNMTKAGMPKGTSTELWILDHPEPLQELQRAYVEAGSPDRVCADLLLQPLQHEEFRQGKRCL